MDGSPFLDRVIRTEQTKHCIFKAERRVIVVFEVCIHAICISLQNSFGFRAELSQFGFGGLTPAKRAQEGICFYLPGAEHFRESAGANVTPGIHLPESFLRMDVSLCKK